MENNLAEKQAGKNLNKSMGSFFGKTDHMVHYLCHKHHYESDMPTLVAISLPKFHTNMIPNISGY